MSETCQRCGEEGEDRRTLWMACFYAMDEMGLPFRLVQIRGVLTEQTGTKEILPGLSAPTYAEPSPGAEPKNYPLFTLRVCKDCRAEWMEFIGLWFRHPPRREESCGSGIFVRRNGVNVEITEEEWREMHPDGREPCRARRTP